MTRVELIETIRNGESSGVEFRWDTIDGWVLAKELVAFSNLRGGRVLLGVDKNRTLLGITQPNLEEWVMTVCRDKIRPELIPYFDVIQDVEPGKDVAVVRVNRSWCGHHVWHDNHRTWYIRFGTRSLEVSKEEVERLFQQRGFFRTEIRAVSGSSLEDLDRRRLLDYFVRVRQQEGPSISDEDGWRNLLINTQILSEEGNRTPATVGGLLLFGRYPNRFLPQAGIDAGVYPGQVKDYAAREQAAFRGPMVALLSEAGLIENGLMEQALEFVRRNTGATETIEGAARPLERYEYPPEVVREAIVNAMIHRDYLPWSIGIELSLYSDRLEVISPGILPNGITAERMRAGCRAARNELLKEVMRDYGYLDSMGMGVPRKIIRGMRGHNGTEPDLTEEEDRFIVRLWKEKSR